MFKLFKNQQKTNIQKPAVYRENNVVLSQCTTVFNYLVHKKHKRREKARNKK